MLYGFVKNDAAANQKIDPDSKIKILNYYTMETKRTIDNYDITMTLKEDVFEMNVIDKTTSDTYYYVIYGKSVRYDYLKYSTALNMIINRDTLKVKLHEDDKLPLVLTKMKTSDTKIIGIHGSYEISVTLTGNQITMSARHLGTNKRYEESFTKLYYSSTLKQSFETLCKSTIVNITLNKKLHIELYEGNTWSFQLHEVESKAEVEQPKPFKSLKDRTSEFNSRYKAIESIIDSFNDSKYIKEFCNNDEFWTPIFIEHGLTNTNHAVGYIYNFKIQSVFEFLRTDKPVSNYDGTTTSPNDLKNELTTKFIDYKELLKDLSDTTIVQLRTKIGVIPVELGKCRNYLDYHESILVNAYGVFLIKDNERIGYIPFTEEDLKAFYYKNASLLFV